MLNLVRVSLTLSRDLTFYTSCEFLFLVKKTPPLQFQNLTSSLQTRLKWKTLSSSKGDDLEGEVSHLHGDIAHSVSL